jgi:glycosyltransferase involved in cell wall biosynthesis
MISTGPHNKPLHVLYVHQHFGTPSGAGGIRSYGFARSLIARGHRVTIVCGGTDRSTTTLTMPFEGGRRQGTVDGIQVVECNIPYATSDGLLRRTINFSKFAIQASRVALTLKYDIIFATSTPLTVVIAGVVARILRRKPFVFEVRDLWPELPKALGLKNPLAIAAMSCLEWLGYNVSNHVIALAPGMADGIAARGCPEDRVTLIPNGCDIDLFDAHPVILPHEMFPDLFGAEDFVAIFAGAHGLANGLSAVLDAAAILKRGQHRNIKITLIGSGATKAELQKRALRESLDNIIFLDPIPKRQLIGLMKGSNIGLQILKNVKAFYNGTSPNKFFDYLAAGIPVLVNYPGWIADLVLENNCGHVVPPDDPEAFAKKLIALAADASALKACGEMSNALARHKFNREDLAEQFCKVIEASHARHPDKLTRTVSDTSLPHNPI